MDRNEGGEEGAVLTNRLRHLEKCQTRPFIMHAEQKQRIYSGWCPHCGEMHVLAADDAMDEARRLMLDLEHHGRVDFAVAEGQASPRFSTDYLFGPARGHMFGVLTGTDASGARCVLRAFSGQYNGCWRVEGWAPPLFDLDQYEAIAVPGDAAVKALGGRMERLSSDDPERKALKRERRALSQRLMKELHALYVLRDFRGNTAPLTDFFPRDRGVPTGAGDCCAPKLLNQAVLLGIRPTGLVEFYWGRENASGTRRHAQFYSSCREKCYPILGFLLCGAIS
ncbi:MAG: hypothetical protein PHG65_12515 [Kiritimatiellae bacterium]|nr:hypothetical protein [Kiritimatiellia bacterium]